MDTLLWQFTAMMMEMARKVTEDQLKNYFPDGLPALPAPKAKPKRPRGPELDLTLGEVCSCVCSLIYCHYARCSGAAAGSCRAVHEKGEGNVDAVAGRDERRVGDDSGRSRGSHLLNHRYANRFLVR